MAKINHLVSAANATQFNGGHCPPVKASNGAYYVFYIETTTLDVVYRKSSNGTVWGAATLIKGEATAMSHLAVWYDRWTPGLSTDLIHLAYTGSSSDDTFYRTLDTDDDSLSTETTIFAGATNATADGALSITRSRGGNVYCKTMIDAGAEGGFFKLLNANVPNGAWEAALTDTEALATQDQWILVPGFASDTNDIMCIFLDFSAAEVSRYVYDDSGNSWGETSISGAGGAAAVDANTSYPHFAVAVDHTNSQILVVLWNAVDAANQDLLGWTVTESAITAFTTNPVVNATDDCGLCAIAIDTDTQDWYVYYGGKSDGSETWTSSVSINYKVSTDDGATWGSETDAAISGSAATADLTSNSGGVPALWACMRFNTRQIITWVLGTATIGFMATVDEPAASGGSGGAHIIGGTVVR